MQSPCERVRNYAQNKGIVSWRNYHLHEEAAKISCKLYKDSSRRRPDVYVKGIYRRVRLLNIIKLKDAHQAAVQCYAQKLRLVITTDYLSLSQ